MIGRNNDVAMTREMLDLEDVLVTDSPIAMGKDKQWKDALAQSRAPGSNTTEAALDLRQLSSEMVNELTGLRLVLTEKLAEGRLLR